MFLELCCSLEIIATILLEAGEKNQLRSNKMEACCELGKKKTSIRISKPYLHLMKNIPTSKVQHHNTRFQIIFVK